jgi:myo-inositol-1(or 4)-monophosphatase
MATTLPSNKDALSVALLAAKRGGDIAQQQRSERSVSISLKAARNLVTTADVAAEKVIIETIKSHFPDHKIFAEESTDAEDQDLFASGPVWVIDPIDGTTNYAHGHNHVAVSVAYVVDGIAQAGAVFAPFHGEMFSATKGGGAFCNDKPIKVSETKTLTEALIATGFPYERSNIENIARRLLGFLRTCRDIRSLGAASLDISWIACGRLDLFYEETLMPWDGVAACLIAREAGARLGRFPYDSESQKKTAKYGNDLCMDNVIVATPGVFDAALKLLEES